MSNWDELIDDLLGSTEKAFVNLSIAYARQNLRNAISAVEQERDEAKNSLPVRRNESVVQYAAIKHLETELKKAEQDAERLAKPRVDNDTGKLHCRHCGGWGWEVEGVDAMYHESDCPVTIYRARVGAK
jgi:rubrerythrin